jgi:hypothetical protein
VESQPRAATVGAADVPATAAAVAAAEAAQAHVGGGCGADRRAGRAHGRVLPLRSVEGRSGPTSAPAVVAAPVATAPLPTPAPMVPMAPEPAPPPPRPPTTTETIEWANRHAAWPTPSSILALNGTLIADAAALRNIPEPDATTHRRAIQAALRAVAQRQRAIRSDVRAAAEQQALAEVCGSAPSVGGWDGELIGSEAYMRRTAHDPGSIDVENCSSPILTRRQCWLSVCQVRGRNAFGAMVLNRVRFSVGRGNTILGAENVN